jgi:glycosyltransferase involved in cell wall biosynthesis
MKVLIWSGNFYPSIGGVQVWACTFAEELVSRGHEVRLMTPEKTDTSDESYSFEVIRTSSPLVFWQSLRWCNVYFQNAEGFEWGKRILLNIKYAGLIVFRRPWIVTHHLHAFDEKSKWNWKDGFRATIYKMATHISICKASAAEFPLPSIVIENFYRDGLFKRSVDIKKDKDVLFVGRLTWYKGVDLLIRAVGLLKKQGSYSEVGIIGVGDDERSFHDLTINEGLTDRIHFLGDKRGAELARLMNEYKIIVIPSIVDRSVWREVFPLVALEGIASGCVIVGSDGGGTKQAIGPCGLTFQGGDVEELSRILQSLLASPEVRDGFLAQANEHLKKFQIKFVVDRYLEVFEQARIHGRFPFSLKPRALPASHV